MGPAGSRVFVKYNKLTTINWIRIPEETPGGWSNTSKGRDWHENTLELHTRLNLSLLYFHRCNHLQTSINEEINSVFMDLFEVFHVFRCCDAVMRDFHQIPKLKANQNTRQVRIFLNDIYRFRRACFKIPARAWNSTVSSSSFACPSWKFCRSKPCVRDNHTRSSNSEIFHHLRADPHQRPV